MLPLCALQNNVPQTQYRLYQYSIDIFEALMNWAVYNITWILILNVAFSPFSWWYLMVDTLGTTAGLTKGSLQT